MPHLEMTGTPWRPRFIWGTAGSEVNWRLRLPMLPWAVEAPTIGGSRTAAGGIPAAYVVRRDDNLVLTLRLYETEVRLARALVAWGQSSEPFSFYPDRENTAVLYTVYLEAPLAGDAFQPVRVGGFPKLFEVSLTVRRTSFGNWDGLDYFPCVDG